MRHLPDTIISQDKLEGSPCDSLLTPVDHVETVEMAHDFNNLLAIILGYCHELIHDGSLSDEQRTVVIEIEKAGDRATCLTRRLLDMSREPLSSARER